MDGGYDISAHEHVVIRQAPPPLDLHWTVARPPIVFGTVEPLPELHRSIAPPQLDLVTVDPRPVVSGNLAAQFTEAGISPVQNGNQVSSSSSLQAHMPGPVSYAGPFAGSLVNGPVAAQNTLVSVLPIISANSSPSVPPLEIPSSQEAAQ